MMDITKTFLLNVKAIKLDSSPNESAKSAVLTESLFKKTKKPDDSKTAKTTFSVAKEGLKIVKNISKIKQFLLDNKKVYINPNQLTENDLINEADRIKFEQHSEEIIRKCMEDFNQLKEKASQQHMTPQFRENQENIFYLLDKYLKDVCKMYSKQKAILVNRTLQTRNNSTLAAFAHGIVLPKPRPTLLKLDHEEEEAKRNLTLAEKALTPQELLEMEKENESLFEDLNIQSQSIRQIESKVIEVTKLSQAFAEEIVSQASKVELIHGAAVETNCNLKGGNEEIKEAMKKSAALRLWILFILLTLSFTLLFLDWYND